MKHAAAAGIVIALGTATAAHAYSAAVTLERLAKLSEIIVLARVVSVRDLRTGNARARIATAAVIDWWKGSSRTSQIEYIASPGWFACDTSDAKAGETVVLFLERDANDRQLHIAHFGRGRMPVGYQQAQLYAAPYEVTLPSQMQIERQRTFPYAQLVLVTSLKAAVTTR